MCNVVQVSLFFGNKPLIAQFMKLTISYENNACGLLKEFWDLWLSCLGYHLLAWHCKMNLLHPTIAPLHDTLGSGAQLRARTGLQYCQCLQVQRLSPSAGAMLTALITKPQSVSQLLREELRKFNMYKPQL